MHCAQHRQTLCLWFTPEAAGAAAAAAAVAALSVAPQGATETLAMLSEASATTTADIMNDAYDMTTL